VRESFLHLYFLLERIYSLLELRKDFRMKYEFKTQPYQHQKDALVASWNKREYALFMEMGTGKSKVLIDNMAILYGKGAIEAALIIAPKGVYRNWSEREVPTHLPEAIAHRIGVWSASPKKKEKEGLINLFDICDELKILVMNVEAFQTKKGVSFAEKFLLAHRTLLAIDESTTIKNHKAVRTKALIKLAKQASYRRILTGFPITQSPLDLYSQAEVLSPQLLGFSSYYSFQNHYGQVINRSFGARTFRQVVGYQNLDELSRKVDTFSFRVLKKDCLDLPNKVYSRREVELTPQQKRVYKELKDYAITELEDKSLVSTNNVLTQMLRLHQVVCGFVNNDDGNEEELDNNRLDELINVLGEMRGKVIIWANYRHDIQAIVRTLQEVAGPESVAAYYGDTSDDEREDVIRRFQDPDSDLLYFVGNTQTGGYGITLTEASNVVYYSNNFDLEKRLQSEDRAHRIGQTNKVTYVDLVSKGTVDEKIVKALRNKLNLAQEVLGDEKWKEWIS
jgi:SNF2 family DNA or RNA helicase